jgi:hypothetical protein
VTAKMQDEGFDAQEVLPGLWLGSEKAFERLEPLQARGIKRVLQVKKKKG